MLCLYLPFRFSAKDPPLCADATDPATLQKRACSVPHSKTTADQTVALKSTPAPVLERFSKLKMLKQKSLIYEIFARSSSASFERQGSYDSGTTCLHGQFPTGHASTSRLSSKNLKFATSIVIPSTSSFSSSIHSQAANHTSQQQKQLFNPTNKRLLTAFKPPNLFSLIANSSTSNNSNSSYLSTIVVNPLINLTTSFNATSCCSTTTKSARSGSGNYRHEANGLF